MCVIYIFFVKKIDVAMWPEFHSGRGKAYLGDLDVNEKKIRNRAMKIAVTLKSEKDCFLCKLTMLIQFRRSYGSNDAG
jgi:hypothetical protein